MSFPKHKFNYLEFLCDVCINSDGVVSTFVSVQHGFVHVYPMK